MLEGLAHLLRGPARQAARVCFGPPAARTVADRTAPFSRLLQLFYRDLHLF